MPESRITRIEATRMFWDNVSDIRCHHNYAGIRKAISEFVRKTANGEFGGDKTFVGKKAEMKGIRHLHVPSKLVLFTFYPDDVTLRLCALTKHDFYGYGSERSNAAKTAVVRLRNGISEPSVPSPSWKTLRWRDPAEITANPEFRELGRDGLEQLYRDVLSETETLAAYRRFTDGMTRQTAESVFDAWVESLEAAQVAIERRILEMAKTPAQHLTPDDFEVWNKI